MSRLLIATNNPGKLAEFRRLLRSLPAEVVGPAEIGLRLEVPEPFDSYAANARAKANAFCRARGLPVLADDSGIEVAALGWGPGVRSARYGGPHLADRAAHLLEQLHGLAARDARMVCWLAVATPAEAGPRIELFSGIVEGTIADAPRGTGGFGYDPIFELPDGRTNAELPDAEKDAISHRGRALAAALPHLREVLAR